MPFLIKSTLWYTMEVEATMAMAIDLAALLAAAECNPPSSCSEGGVERGEGAGCTGRRTSTGFLADGWWLIGLRILQLQA
jgi:hypothetical protein